MSKILFFCLIFLRILVAIQAAKRCNLRDCNYEGECQANKNKKSCTCFGSKYFTGPKCSEAVNNCQNENPCQNGGKCKNVVGQFICEDCNAGFGGLWCDLEISNIFDKMLLYFNHYAFYGEIHKFLIMVETLGRTPFSLEFVSDNYAIDSFQTIPADGKKWTYSQDLAKEIKKLGIRYYNDLPYLKGYYHIASSKFWNVGLLDLDLHSYDSDTATQLLYQNQFKLFLLTRQAEECVPHLSFIYGTNPLDPLKLDIASYNNFEIVLEKRCFKNSKILYHWSVYSVIGERKLHDFGTTTKLLLKVKPYKFWFNYHGEVMSSYRIVVTMLEEYNGKKMQTKARCFILVLPKPVSAIIRGGHYREIGSKQSLILDASDSRDFALASDASQDLIFTWNCMSEGDVNNAYYKYNIGSSPIIKIKPETLFANNTFNFSLTIRSKINKFVSDETYQTVKIMENTKLDVDIKCLQNCVRNEFVQNVFIHLKAIPLVGQFSKAAIYKWDVENLMVADKVNFIYLTKETDKILNIQVTVQDRNLSGSAIKRFNVNLPPANGSCSIEPKAGEAFVTNFYVKCENYFDTDEPLNYEYLTETGFPLQRTNEAEIFTKLPQCNAVLIKICDQFQACSQTTLKITVNPLNEVEDVKKFLSDNGGVDLKNLLKTGHILPAMISLKSVTPFVKTVVDISTVIHELMEFHLQTLLQAEQFLEICLNLVRNNLPLMAAKAQIFHQYFVKLQQGLTTFVKDEEIATFKRLNYEKSCKDLLQILQIFSQTWENLAAVQIAVTPTILSSNPLIETKLELSDFDVEVAVRLESWLEVSKAIQDCLAKLNMGSTNLYTSWQDGFFVNENNLNLQMYGFDNETQQIIKLNDIKIILNKACVRDLHKIWPNQNILIQAISLNANPFWWYPNERPLNSEVFLLSLFESKAGNTVKYLKQPFQFQLKLKATNSRENVVVGIIKNKLHMAVFVINLPANAVLIITFLHAEISLKFFLEINKIPKSFEVIKSGYKVENTKEKQIFIFANNFNKPSQGFAAILMESHYENVSFSFSVTINECLYWDYGLKQPQWSSQGCKPKLEIPQNESLTCYCHHFSTFAARSYASTVQEDLKEHWLLTQLAINWYLVACYCCLIIVFVLILLLNYNQYQKHIKFLPTNLNLSNLNNNDIEVIIFTGCHLNATSTANITLRLISQKGPFSLTINQNPEKPFLKRNSMCKLLLSSQQVDIPLKLTIANDQSGRYASWQCHKIIVKNLKTLQQQIFIINQWICERPVEIFKADESQLKFKARFRQNLNNIYTNWYQGQSLWGCWLYEDLNRLERSCIEVSSLMVCVCFVACYYGPTTMETYEEERNLYKDLDFDIYKLFLLSIICYVLYFVVKFIFTLMLHREK